MKKILLAFAIAIPLILLLIGIIAGFMFLTTSTDEVKYADYPCLLNARDLKAYDISIDESGNSEKTTLSRYIDMSKEVEYEYDSPDDENYDSLYVSSSLETETSRKFARDTYKIGLLAYKAGRFYANLKLSELDEKIKWGDESYCGIFERDGEKVGMLFMGRKGKCVYTAVIIGLYSSDGAIATDVILPKLASIK